jgi:exodeoxyribonuclease VII large subunit
VTSGSGAAIHDILSVLRRRHAAVDVLLMPVKVQGEGAATEIAAAIRDFNLYRDVDVIITGRGGGSIEDLWAFNEEIVARAIYSSRIPVISAVGHEVDFTIADFVADLRAPTPSAAAEMVIRSRYELDEQIGNLRRRLVAALERELSERRERLEGMVRALKDPSLFVGQLMQRVDDLSDRLERSFRGRLLLLRERLTGYAHRVTSCNPALEVERRRERLIALTGVIETAVRRILDASHEKSAVNCARLHTLSPFATLERGYCIARKAPRGDIVHDSRTLDNGDRLRLTFRYGTASCIVEEREE